MTPKSIGDRGNLLIVDDQPDNLRLLAEILIQDGYKVRKAVNGARALEAAQLAPPDLILLDIMMPEMTGYEVCQGLKADTRTRDIPVIFLSALDSLDDKINAFALGGVDYIIKPFQKGEVLVRVRTHLKLQTLTKTLQQQNGLLSEEIEQRKAAEVALKQALENLKAAQAQIVAKEKLAALGTLTAGVAHELRNPLNFVNNYAECSVELVAELLEGLDHSMGQWDSATVDLMRQLLTDLRDNAAAIHQHGQRAEHIIQSMMHHARKECSIPQHTDLNTLLDEAVDLAYRSKRVHNYAGQVAIAKAYDSHLEPLLCFPTELRRVFINLLDNAFYAVVKKHQDIGDPFQPTVSVQTAQQANVVEIRIRDNGMGIAAADQPKIFEPFFTTKPTHQGTGLGLSITHEIIVNQHGGTLTLDTEVGSFTEFTIALPILPKPNPSAQSINLGYFLEDL